jgi:hypothetical protein
VAAPALVEGAVNGLVEPDPVWRVCGHEDRHARERHLAGHGR